MSTPSTAHGRRGTLAVAAAGVVLALGGGSAVAAGLVQQSTGPEQPALVTATTSPDAGGKPASTAPAVPPPSASAARPTTSTVPVASDLDVPTMVRSAPVALQIPSIGVRSPELVRLGKQTDGTLEVPEDYGQPGWYQDGPAPGQFGPAVIAGHVDSKDGPGIFFRLGELKAGAKVIVTRADGTTATFVVDAVERYRKAAFPTVAVYGDTTHRSELRLITCGGEFDPRTGHYVDNVVAYAHLL